ncbi:MAG: glutamine synthetase beta-grasp domain-containing protein, partial [Candidatus Omnitrophota bacterium]|nr:glutamine synthetase beta-grasp domain-containing protein [Candidatus Omnitrophota bacterium]
MPRVAVAEARRVRRVAQERAVTRSLAGTTNSKPPSPSITEEGVKRVWQLIRQHNITVVDLKFNDLPGLWQHFSIPVSELDQSAKKGLWVDGIGFDGSSIRGFQKIQESDMNLFPDATTAVRDPICSTPTLSLICDIYDPLTKEAYSRDPRFIARKAELYLKKTGIADTSYWGPEPEFFIFDDIRF